MPPVAKSEAARFANDRAGVVGLAYDVVSRRFLFADRVARKLVVVGDGSNRPQDLVRAESAGFKDISALEIDDKRGDLWVASGGSAVLRVPSVIVPGESNYLLNPGHADFRRLRIGAPASFPFDARLLRAARRGVSDERG